MASVQEARVNIGAETTQLENANIPEVAQMSKASFEMVEQDVVVVSLPTTEGQSIRFRIGLAGFMLGMTGAVAFMNMHLPSLFDMIGGP